MPHSPRIRASRFRRSTRLVAGEAVAKAILYALVASLWGAAAIAGSPFAPHVEYPTGSNPVHLAIGDLNGDNKPDVVVANHNSNTVSVLLGNGAGGFGPRSDFATLITPVSVAIGDVSGDGKPDLAVAEFDASRVEVRLGDGAGGFGPATAFITETHPTSVTMADLNRDTRPDLVVAKESTNNVSVLLGDGAGGFGPETSFPVGSIPVSVASGDFNGDAKPDLVVVNDGSNTVSVLLGDGAGGFGAKTDFGTGINPVSVAIGDLNADGRPDLAVVNGNGHNTVSVLLGNADGSFGTKTDFPTGANANSVAIGDLSADGKRDLVVANADANTVSVLLGNGDGTFGAKTDVATGNHPPAVAVADLNGDGHLDAVTADQFGNTISVLLANLSGRIASIRDVADDQGGKVHVLWDAAFLDSAPGYGISSYDLWRRITTTAALQAVQRGAAHLATGANFERGAESRTIRVTTEGARSLYWEFVATVPARGQSGYGYMASTTSDSMASGIPWNVFFLDAKHATTSAFYVSAPDSGYSVDNLPPGPPAPFAGEYLPVSNATALHWGNSLEPDFSYYRLYRGGAANFVPSPGNLIAAQGDTGYTDAGALAQYYKLSAVDVHGNESGYALLTPSQTLGVGGSAPLAFALGGAWPNPARGSRFTVSFALPIAAPARLELLDVGGRLVVAREVGSLGVGRHAVDLAAGRRLAPGLYLVRLSQGRNLRATRVAVLD